MEIHKTLKHVSKDHVLKIFLLSVCFILIFQIFSGSLQPAKDYILKIAGEVSTPVSKDVSESSRKRDLATEVATKTTTTQEQTTSTTAATTQPTSLKAKKTAESVTRIKIFDLNKPLDPDDIYDRIQCRKSLKIFVSTTLCVHDLANDVHVSRDVMRDGVWERHIVGRSQLASF